MQTAKGKACMSTWAEGEAILPEVSDTTQMVGTESCLGACPGAWVEKLDHERYWLQIHILEQAMADLD